ncbi:MAG: helix-turn-helix domain-containing protein [Verrucomicrobiota bacterium]|jgi:hemolysin activation/secretion protein/AraC-like DNA-binding protein
MTVERHLILQELTLPPSAEWPPQCHGWIVARVAEGTGYWLQPGASARELTTGDGLVAARNSNGVIRASQLSPLKLQFFIVQPQHLNGLLTVSEWHQLEVAPNELSAHASIFTAGELIGQKFTRIAGQSQNEKLAVRCVMLQIWANAVAGLLNTSISSFTDGHKLRERFRQLVNEMTEAELSERSLPDLAKQLHCSERHFSRLFREEFGVPFRARQIELRLQRARQLLVDSNAKIINVAYDSGYRHLGLFNAMFKKRFGVTPSEWRQQSVRKNLPAQPRHSLKLTARIGILIALLFLNFTCVFAQTNSAPATEADSTARTRTSNSQPKFEVRHYEIIGNSLLSPKPFNDIFAKAIGKEVSLDQIRKALADLQMEYRERGFVTVAVSLPQQKLTNATIKVQVTEGVLTKIDVTGNRYFSSENVLRALPSLHTNLLLNSHVFQRELDLANASRDRQIYPVIGPGPEPGTTELTLKVKDRLPLHARLELNNETPNATPDLRLNSSAQYDNLWDLEHQVGLQYSFSFLEYKNGDTYSKTFFDDPLVANYSGYYRLPLGGYTSVQQQVDANPSSFGYNEITHQFNLPPATGRPELTFYASRSVTDTGVLLGPNAFLSDTTATNGSGVIFHPLTITTNSAGENITVNEDLGLKLTLPMQLKKVAASLSLGADFKRYQVASFNTNENFFATEYYDSQGLHIDNTSAPQGEPTVKSSLDYLPLNVGLNGSMPDKWGTTFFNAQANFNVLTVFSEDFGGVSYTPKARENYVTLQLGADRIQTIYKDWSVKLHADGQWANEPLFFNEQYAMGGVMGVRGYPNGEAYGDTGWRVSIEPQTPQVSIGMVDGDKPFWVRASVFMDYGKVSALAGYYVRRNGISLSTSAIPGNPSQLDFWGVGWSFIMNIGEHLDARLTMAFPLINQDASPGWSPLNNRQIYFGIGAQF